jgi:predicted nucleotidyltransferase
MNLSTVEMIKVIAIALGELNERAVFVGGAAIPFYLPAAYLPVARPTEDIDVVMEIVSHSDNAFLEDTLRAKGFRNDTSEEAPICRWIYGDFKVDIMSVDESAFGFSNRWYREGFESAIEAVSNPVPVKIFTLPYFIAAKIVAFRNRGQNDYMGSRDIEDIISLVEVADETLFENVLPRVSPDLVVFLKEEFSLLLSTRHFVDCVPGAVFNRIYTTEAVTKVKTRMQRVVEML